jgi:hypothetical protein
MAAIKKELEGFSKRKELAWGNLTYNLQRLDLLIISISGAGIYTSLELSKFLFEQKFCSHTLAKFKFPAIIFLMAIIFNLISQYTGYLSNKYEYLLCDEQIENHGFENDDFIKNEINRLDKNANISDRWTSALNLSSLILLIIGLIILIIFFFNITF